MKMKKKTQKLLSSFSLIEPTLPDPGTGKGHTIMSPSTSGPRKRYLAHKYYHIELPILSMFRSQFVFPRTKCYALQILFFFFFFFFFLFFLPIIKRCSFFRSFFLFFFFFFPVTFINTTVNQQSLRLISIKHSPIGGGGFIVLSRTRTNSQGN